MKLVLTLAYDGSDYRGFQKQPGVLTVQEVVEKAWVKVFPPICKPSQGAGRTDAGVHATEQVLAIPLHPKALKRVDKITLNKLPQVLNAHLPSAVRVIKAVLAGEEFHPRYRARVRCYRYRIISVPPGVPYLPEDFSRCYPVPFPIDLPRLEGYFRFLEGKHDFTSFASWDSNNSRPPNPVRIIYKIDLLARGREVWIDIYAESFLKGMVRSLVGNVLFQYRKNHPPEIMEEILLAQDPALAKQRVPAQALFLRRVFFVPLFGNRDNYF